MGLQRQLTLHRLAQDHAGDQQPVDLVGASKIRLTPLVAVEALGRVVADETIAAVDLHDLVDGLGQDLAAEDLGDAALGGILLDALLVLVVIVRSPLLDGLELPVEQSGQAIDQ